MPADCAPDIYQKLMDYDPEIVDWGGVAMNAMRLEKGEDSATSIPCGVIFFVYSGAFFPELFLSAALYFVAV